MTPKRGAAARARVKKVLYQAGSACGACGDTKLAERMTSRERRCGDPKLVRLLTRWCDAERRADVAFDVHQRTGTDRTWDKFKAAEARADEAWHALALYVGVVS